MSNNQTILQSNTPYNENQAPAHWEGYKDDAIYFHLPDYSQHFKLNILIASLLLEHPEYFYDNIQIGSVYGSFPGAIWNGGRVVLGGFAGREDIKRVYQAFNSLGIPVRHTFTNGLIDEKMCYDTYCNMIMELGDGGFNQVLVNSPALEQYIEEEYPKYLRLSSTTKRIKNLDLVKKEFEKGYELVVLDYALNRDPNIFFLPREVRSHLEILINAYCMDDCPRRAQHYREMANDTIHFGHMGPVEPFKDEIGGCQYIGDDFYEALANRKSILRVEELYDFYLDNGFHHFKIEGRTINPFDVLESYCYYMVKPEWRDRVRLMVLKRLFREDPPQQPIAVLTEAQMEELQRTGKIPDQVPAVDPNGNLLTAPGPQVNKPVSQPVVVQDTNWGTPVATQHECDGSCGGNCNGTCGH